MREHEIFEMDVDGVQTYAIKFNDEPYAGLSFSFGRVEMAEDESSEELTMKFDYTIHAEPAVSYAVTDLEPYLGDFLVELIAKQLEDQEIIYRGGTEAPRPKRDDE